jgi:hypothetical protein
MHPTDPCPECGAHYKGDNIFDLGKGGFLGMTRDESGNWQSFECKTCAERSRESFARIGRECAERVNMAFLNAMGLGGDSPLTSNTTP